MKKYAVLNNNIVTEIALLETEDSIAKAMVSQMVVDVDDLLIQPEIGWVLVGNEIKPASPLSAEARLIKIMQMRFKFGNQLADLMVQKMSIRNVTLIAAGQTMNINAVIQTFSGIEAALRKCAIPTARAGIIAMSATYTDYSEEFAFALSELNNYLNIENIL